MNLTVALQIVALILGIMASFNWPGGSRDRLFPAAFSFFIGSLLVGVL